MKILLGLLIVPFIFFFGYTQITQATQDVALEVNGEDIPFTLYQLFYDQEYDRYRQIFQGEIPEFALQSIAAATERQMVQRKIMFQFANDLGLSVTDQELADWIVKNFKDASGEFDPIGYKNYLSQFQTRNRISYEDLLREDLTLQKFNTWMSRSEVETSKEKTLMEAQKATRWILEVRENAKDSKEKIPASQKIDPLTITEYQKLFGGQLDLQDYVSIFRLEKGKTFSKEKEGKVYWTRMISKEKNKEASKEPTQKLSLGDAWLNDTIEAAKIKSHIPKPSSL